MNRDFVRIGLAALGAASLFFLYLIFLTSLAPALSQADPVEQLIFFTLFLRLVAVASIRRLRNSPPQLKISIFSMEIFFIAVLIIAFFVTGESFYDISMGQVLTIWVASITILLTPYTVVWFAISMYRRATLGSVLSAAVPEYASLLFLVNLVQLESTPTSLAGLGNILINAVVGVVRARPTSIFTYNEEIVGASVLFYIVLLLYATFVNHFEASTLRSSKALVLPFAATIFLLLWTYSLSLFTTSILFVLTAPASLLLISIWWITRGK